MRAFADFYRGQHQEFPPANVSIDDSRVQFELLEPDGALRWTVPSSEWSGVAQLLADRLCSGHE